MEGVFDEALTIDFYEYKSNNHHLVDNKQLVTLSNESQSNHDYNYIYSNVIAIKEITNNIDNSISMFLSQYYPKVYDILLLGNGNISICRLSILDIMINCSLRQVDLYFHCKISLAQRLILNIFKMVNKTPIIKNNKILITMDKYTISISPDIYVDEFSILRSIEPIIEQQGYNPVKKYFSTMSGAVSLIKRVCPMNIVSDKLEYINRGFNILLRSTKFIGITGDRYVAFSNIKKKFNINGDIFYLLCLAWLKVESYVCRKFLLSLV